VPGEKEKAKKDTYQKALAAFEQAMKMYHKGDYSKAFELLTVFLEKYDSENELVDRAKMYINIIDKKGQGNTAVLKSFDDYYQNGIYNANNGDLEEALKLLTKAQSMEPKEGKVYYLLSTVFGRMNNSEQCFESLKKAVAIDNHFAVMAQNEEDFGPLKEDEQFKRITEGE